MSASEKASIVTARLILGNGDRDDQTAGSGLQRRPRVVGAHSRKETILKNRFGNAVAARMPSEYENANLFFNTYSCKIGVFREQSECSRLGMHEKVSLRGVFDYSKLCIRQRSRPKLPLQRFWCRLRFVTG